ncbi:TPA: hypothetical protein NJY08_004383 [Salmonella enterica subsp. enterica serovar Typhi str. AG3]|nr:hypothetical protein [Salmonella enterica subsp. enterica serovar Typhi str. AG3]
MGVFVDAITRMKDSMFKNLSEAEHGAYDTAKFEVPVDDLVRLHEEAVKFEDEKRRLIQGNEALKKQRSEWKGKVTRSKNQLKDLRWKLRGARIHVDRLQNQVNAVEHAFECRNKEIEMLVNLLNENNIDSPLKDFYYRVEAARKALREQ